MKKIKFKKIALLVLWICFIAGMITLLAFVNAEEKEVKGKSLSININTDEENHFIDEDDVVAFLKERGDTLINQPMKKINVYELEKALNAHPAVANADVSVDVNGAVNIEMKQRKPIVRLINLNGESYYIDDNALLMPMSDKYAARVLIASGYIYERYAQFYRYNMEKLKEDTVISKVTVLDDVYSVSDYILKDTLLNKLIHQLYVNEQKEFELFPVIGNHKIIFGDANNIEEKFNKLKIFYKEGLNSMNNWNKYSAINLKYKDQVVCTKK